MLTLFGAACLVAAAVAVTVAYVALRFLTVRRRPARRRPPIRHRQPDASKSVVIDGYTYPSDSVARVCKDDRP